MRGVAELDSFFSALREHFRVGQKAALISGNKKKKRSCCLCSGGRIWRRGGGDIGAFPPKVTGGLCRFVKCCELDQFLR